MKQVAILWKGDLPLSSLKWEFDTTKEIAFTLKIEEKIADFWQKAVQNKPTLYDGTLLCLHNIDYNSPEIKLILGFIPFSVVFYHYQNKLPLKVTMGSLGFQVLIYNPNRTHILVGERAATSDYKPGYLTVPGGIFEKDDLEGSIVTACQREIIEETSLETKSDSFKLLSIYREDHKVATGLLVEVETRNEIDVNEHSTLAISGNEEFENQQLTWFPCSRLNELKDKLMLEGLRLTINDNIIV